MREVHAVLKRELERRAAEWQAIVESEIPALNARARELTVDFVLPPLAGGP
jgi:hypothetical protein